MRLVWNHLIMKSLNDDQNIFFQLCHVLLVLCCFIIYSNSLIVSGFESGYKITNAYGTIVPYVGNTGMTKHLLVMELSTVFLLSNRNTFLFHNYVRIQ